MRQFLLGFGVALLLVGAASAQEAMKQELQLGRMTEWSGENGTLSFSFGDVSMVIEVDMPADEDWAETARLTVTRPGAAPHVATSTAGLKGVGDLGVFQIDTDGAPTIIFQSYSGGAHCCTEVKLVHLGKGALRTEELGPFDGGGITLEDIDGDGLAELRSSDGFFLYAFDAYAFSFPPPVIHVSTDGVVRDASTEARFQPVFAEAFNRTAPSCISESGEHYAGACAGLLAVAARLDIYEGVKAMLAPVLAQSGPLDTGWDEFSLCLDDNCNEQREFDAFLPAVDYALQQWGYLTGKKGKTSRK